MAALIFYQRLAESDIIVPPSVTCMDLLHWWYNHAAHLVSFNTIGFYYQCDWEMSINNL